MSEYTSPKIARFSKVPFSEFQRAWNSKFPEDSVNISEGSLREIYENIKLPQRATSGSAGYDFFAPKSFTLRVGESINIPTGIRCEMFEGWALFIHPRSGHGFKYGIHLANSTGIVDRDFAYTDTSGHIHVKLVNDSSIAKDMTVNTGDAFCQGVLLPYGVTVDDDEYEKEVRIGGFGSTNKK